MSEVTVNGKRVTFRERIPLRIGARLPKLATAIDAEDFLTLVPVLQILVESWEFAGEPSDAAAYDDLDLFAEMMPLARAAGEELQRRMEEQSPKATSGESSSG